MAKINNNKILFVTKKINTLILKRVNLDQIFITLNGPLGSLKFIRRFFSIVSNFVSKKIVIKDDNNLLLTSRAELFSFFGEVSSRYDWLIAGFFHEFIIRGIGYRYRYHRANNKNSLLFKIGYGHKVLFLLSSMPDIRFRNNRRYDFVLTSLNKAKLRQFAEQVRLVKPIDAYKGKGIKYYHDLLKLKVGKVR
jgi:large subunit ribosomal protein L6